MNIENLRGLGSFQFDSEELRSRMFQHIDRNRDGAISFEEMEAALESDKQDATKQIFAEFDADADGFLNEEEFASLADQIQLQIQNRMRIALSLGLMSGDKFSQLLKILNSSESAKDFEAARQIQTQNATDPNQQDGAIYLPEGIRSSRELRTHERRKP
ncbi:MAG: EF-hand domain-containing protein [Opitutales bacterium]